MSTWVIGGSDDDDPGGAASIVSIGSITNSVFAIGPGATVVNGTAYVDGRDFEDETYVEGSGQ